jgi:signal transduction histidine kinase
MLGRIFNILGLFLLFGISDLYAASFTVNKAGNHELSQAIEYWQETSERISLEQASQQPLWQASGTDNINLGFSSSPYWFKTTIDHQQTQLDWFIRIIYPPLDYINVYVCDREVITDREQQCQTSQLGDRLPFSQRERFNPNYVIPVSLAAGMNYIYLEVITEGSYQLPISLIDRQSLDNYLASNDFFRGGYLTLMLVMMLYNFFIYMMTRSKTYLFYSGFVFTFALFHMTYEGSGFQFLWPQHPEFNQYAMPIAFALNQIFTILFVVKFLNLKHIKRTNYHYFNTLLVLAIATLILVPIIPYKLFIPIQNFLSITITSSAFYLGLKYWRKKQSAARLFTIAWAVFITGVVTANLRTLGILPSNFFTQYGYQIGSFLEVILLSLALGERIQRLQQDRIHAKQALLQEKQALVQEKQEKMFALQQLIAGVCHEMNTPIGNISLSNSYLSDMTDQLKEYDIATLQPSILLEHIEDQATAIGMIKSSTSALSSLTQIFRSIKIDEEDHPKTSFDVSQLIFDKVDSFKDKASFQLDLPKQLILNSYPSAFHLIFDQLIINSLDHYPKAQQASLIISINLQVINEELKIIFSDNGKNLPAEELEQLFLPFFTKARGVNKKLGLGMYQVKNIINDLLQGDIKPSTSKAGGLQLCLHLPYKTKA